MYSSNMYDVNSSCVPANYTSGFRHQETNSSHANSSNSSHYTYDYNGWTPRSAQEPISVVEGAGCSELHQPGSLTNLDHPIVGSDAVNTDLQNTNYARNEPCVTMNNFEDYNGQVNKGHETGQFVTQIDKFTVPGAATNNFENSNSQVYRGSETGQFKRKLSDESQTLGEDLENMKVTKQLKEECIKLLKRPADFFTNAPMWRLLWFYGLQSYDVMKESHERQRYDYINQIGNLINILKINNDQFVSGIKLNERKHGIDYQIITPDGKVLREVDFPDFSVVVQAISHFKLDGRNKRVTYCCSPLCKNCRFKVNGSHREKVLEHIYELMNLNFRCVDCGLVFNKLNQLKAHIMSYFKSYNEPLFYPSLCLSSEAANNETKYKIKEIDQFSKRFLAWVCMLLEFISRKHGLTHLSPIALLERFRNGFDYNFPEFYKQIDDMDPTYKRYSVEMGDNRSHSIIYWSQRLDIMNKHPGRSAMFAIVEKGIKQSIPFQQLLDIAKETLHNSDNKCHYNGCPCGGSYSSPFPSALVGHVLISNILIVCLGCHIGFADYNKFEMHLTSSDCFAFTLPK